MAPLFLIQLTENDNRIIFAHEMARKKMRYLSE